MAESTRRLSDLHKIIDEVDSFVNSNISEKLANYEREIETSQNSLTEFTNKRKSIEQAISKLKEEVAFQEIGKRELHDNMTLRKTKEAVEILKEEYRQLSVKLKAMNYNEITRKWEQLENEKQVLLRQVSVYIVTS